MRRQRELRIFSGWFGNRPLPATRTLTDHGGENRPIAGELLRFFRRRVAVGGVRHGIIDAPNLGTRVVDQLFDSALVLDGVQNFPAADSASEIADHLHMAADFSEKRTIERVRMRRPSNGITVLRIARNRRDRSLYLPSLFVVDDPMPSAVARRTPRPTATPTMGLAVSTPAPAPAPSPAASGATCPSATQPDSVQEAASQASAAGRHRLRFADARVLPAQLAIGGTSTRCRFRRSLRLPAPPCP